MMKLFRRSRSKSVQAEINELAVQIAGASISRLKAQGAFTGGTVVNTTQEHRAGGAKYPNGISESASFGIDHYRMRTNARDAYHDTPQARAIVERFADTVADVGLMLEPAPKADILGMTSQEAERWSSRTEERFDSWARSKLQNRSESMTWYQSHRLYQIFQHRDNDIFTRLYYSPDRALLNPLQFEMLDTNQIRGDAYTSTVYMNGRPQDGIKRDVRGRELSYGVWVQNEKGEFVSITVPRIGPRSKKIMMLHGFSPEYAGQARGYSRLGHALQEFQNLTDFSLSVIQKAINNASVNMYVKPSIDEPAVNPFEEILSSGGAGPAAAQYGAAPTPSSEAQNVTTDSTRPVSFYDLPEATFRRPGVGVFNLRAGQDLRAFEGGSVSESYNSFVDAFCGYLSAAESMPIEVLLMKFNQNYSASRGTLILFWRVVTIWREEMVNDYCAPIYEMWLSGEIAAGRILCPGWSDSRLRAAWLNARWIGSPMPNIDPEKTAQADKHYIEMGAQTLDRVSRNLNGSSGKANRAKLAREIPELTPAPWSKNSQPDVQRVRSE